MIRSTSAWVSLIGRVGASINSGVAVSICSGAVAGRHATPGHRTRGHPHRRRASRTAAATCRSFCWPSPLPPGCTRVEVAAPPAVGKCLLEMTPWARSLGCDRCRGCGIDESGCRCGQAVEEVRPARNHQRTMRWSPCGVSGRRKVGRRGSEWADFDRPHRHRAVDRSSGALAGLHEDGEV